MPALLLALAVLAILGLGIFWFLRANPSSVARALRPILVLAGGIGIGGLLIFGVRFLPGLLPELFGLLGVLGTALIARYMRQRPAGGGFSSPGAGQRTEVRTAFVEAWIDHATGDVGGRIVKGRFAGRGLDMLADGDLLELHAECAGDADSLRVLESYLDRRLGADWRRAQSPPHGPRTDMTRDERARHPRPHRGGHGGGDSRRASPPHPQGSSRCRRQRRSRGTHQSCQGCSARMTCRGGRAVASTGPGASHQIIDLFV